MNFGWSDKNTTPWAPWRLPSACNSAFTDPRVLLHSKFAHGLIFNILYKAVHADQAKAGKEVSEQILSLTIFLVELALSYPQTDYSGKVGLAGPVLPSD